MTHKLKPLCLHERIQSPDTERPFSQATITGTFSLVDIHAWLALMLPGMPPSAPAPVDDTVLAAYESRAVGTQLIVHYKEGELRVRSDSVSSLSILHENIMLQASSMRQQVRLDIRHAFTCPKDSVSSEVVMFMQTCGIHVRSMLHEIVVRPAYSVCSQDRPDVQHRCRLSYVANQFPKHESTRCVAAANRAL